jgi:nucleoside-diphosphate-sugar epimerase
MAVRNVLADIITCQRYILRQLRPLYCKPREHLLSMTPHSKDKSELFNRLPVILVQFTAAYAMVAGFQATVFLMGVTGFLGKVILEEIIRRFEEFFVDKMILLVRPSKAYTAGESFQKEVVSPICFSALDPRWIHLVTIIQSDLTLPDCGICPEALYEIRSRATHIINCAACVAFEVSLKEAVRANVASALNLTKLAKSCRNPKQTVTVSTAYVAPYT